MTKGCGELMMACGFGMIRVGTSLIVSIGRSDWSRDGHIGTSGWVDDDVCGLVGVPRIAGLAYQMVQPSARAGLIYATAGDGA